MRERLKDALLVTAVFALISGAYFGFAVTERYRGFTKAHLEQTEALLELIQSQQSKK
jgi:hypothetical protein